MKICICCSLSFTNEVEKLVEELKALGHEVLIPHGVEIHAIEQPDFNPVAAKHDNGYDSMNAHFAKIRESDAIIVCNYTKKGIENYIGANTFLEMGYAYSLGLPIYTLNPLPDMPYINDELKAFNTISLSGDLLKI